MRTFYAACAALSITHATFAATTIEFDGRGEGPHTIMISKGKVLMRADRDEDMLYDDRARQMTVISHAERGYYVMDPKTMTESMQQMQAQSRQQMQQMQQQMGPVMEQMRQQMQALMDDPDIPEQQKKMIRQQMAQMSDATASMPRAGAGGMPAPEPMRVRATGESRKVAGYTCKVHRMSQGGRDLQELCIASRQAVGVPQADYQTMQNMFAFMRELAEQTMAAAGMHGGGPAFPEMDGVPVEIRDLADGTVSVLRSVSTKAIADSRFAIPSGYREQDPFGR